MSGLQLSNGSFLQNLMFRRTQNSVTYAKLKLELATISFQPFLRL